MHRYLFFLWNDCSALCWIMKYTIGFKVYTIKNKKSKSQEGSIPQSDKFLSEDEDVKEFFFSLLSTYCFSSLLVYHPFFFSLLVWGSFCNYFMLVVVAVAYYGNTIGYSIGDYDSLNILILWIFYPIVFNAMFYLYFFILSCLIFLSFPCF